MGGEGNNTMTQRNTSTRPEEEKDPGTRRYKTHINTMKEVTKGMLEPICTHLSQTVLALRDRSTVKEARRGEVRVP